MVAAKRLRILPSNTLFSQYLNVGLDNIKLKLAPPDNNVPYLTAYYSMGDLIYGSSILLAGWLFDRLEDRGFDTLNIYACTFLLGWLGRTLVVALLVPIEEPGAWRVRDLAAFGVRKLFGRAPTTQESGP